MKTQLLKLLAQMQRSDPSRDFRKDDCRELRRDETREIRRDETREPRKEESQPFRAVRPPTVRSGFTDSRRKLMDILQQLTFVRVAFVSFPTDTYRTGTHFQGEAMEIFPGRSHDHKPRTAFFSRYSRQTGQGFTLLGSFTVIDSAVGSHHASAIPQVGDILVGSMVPTTKGKIGFELRGWCNNAKPLLELARIVQYGSKMPEQEIKRMLKQSASETANALLKLNKSLTPQEKQHATLAAQSADDFWCLVRAVCFGQLEEDKTLKLSKPFPEMIDSLALRFGDEELLEAWSAVRPADPEPPAAPSASSYSLGSYAAAQAYVNQVSAQQQAQQPKITWGFVPPTSGGVTSGASATAVLSAAVEYTPSSPVYQPTTPPDEGYVQRTTPPDEGYVQRTTPPDSGYAPATPPDATYVPSSPQYAPSSPPEGPKTPESDADMSESERS